LAVATAQSGNAAGNTLDKAKEKARHRRAFCVTPQWSVQKW
jgi:hypothetical protein